MSHILAQPFIILLVFASFAAAAAPLDGVLPPSLKRAELWEQTAKITEPGFTRYAEFGSGVAYDGRTLAIAAPTYEDSSLSPKHGVGGLSLWERQDGAWTRLATFAGEQWRGHLGQAIDVDGDIAVAGAPGRYVSNSTKVNCDGRHAPLAYVFERVDGVWSLAAQLTGSGRCFGSSVAVRGDTIFVGDYLWDQSVQVFRRTESGWQQEETLTAPGAGTSYFGRVIQVSEDGRTAAISASVTGKVYFFQLTESRWSLLDVVDAHFDNDNLCPGASMAMDASASTLVIGDPCYHRTFANGQQLRAGVAYVLEKRDAGWLVVARLTPDDEHAISGSFATALAIEDNVIVAGSPADDRTPGLLFTNVGTPCDGASPADPCGRAGALFAYKRDGTGSWAPVAKVRAADGARNDYLGYSIALHDGTVVAGAPNHANYGAAYSFRAIGKLLPEV